MAAKFVEVTYMTVHEEHRRTDDFEKFLNHTILEGQSLSQDNKKPNTIFFA